MRVESFSLCFLIAVLSFMQTGQAQGLQSDIPYIDDGHNRHLLDIYSPAPKDQAKLPVVFWIHGGGWQAGDKSDVALKPKLVTERGFLFVSTNYRLLPEVSMEVLTQYVAKSLAWVHKNIARHCMDERCLPLVTDRRTLGGVGHGKCRDCGGQFGEPSD